VRAEVNTFLYDGMINESPESAHRTDLDFFVTSFPSSLVRFRMIKGSNVTTIEPLPNEQNI
jgi:hypothetical protein